MLKKILGKYKKEMGTGIKDITWTKEYEPVIDYAVNLLKTKDAPINADKLLEICAKNGIEKVIDFMADAQKEYCTKTINL